MLPRSVRLESMSQTYVGQYMVVRALFGLSAVAMPDVLLRNAGTGRVEKPLSRDSGGA
jgi:hypothetical protein